MTTFSQRLKKRKGLMRSPIRVHEMDTPTTLLAAMVKEHVKKQMAAIEFEIRKMADNAVEQVRTLVPQLKAKSIQEIEQHIRTRAIEIRGAKGESGKDGVGTQGIPGKDGQSIIGPAGNDGQDGHTYSETELKEMFTPILKNLYEEYAKRIQQMLSRRKDGGGGGGGGGMGACQHEIKNTSSATTTVSTTYPIAAGGAAVMAYYNGQQIQKDTHFTVGADRKTLTLLFVPDDDTNINLVYVR